MLPTVDTAPGVRVAADARDEEMVASTIRVEETVGLAAIFEPHLNVAVLEREERTALRHYAERLAVEAPLVFKATAAFDEEHGVDGLDDLVRLLPPDDARDVLVDDIAYWIEVLTEMTGAEAVGVRLTQLRAPMCPGFHVDRVTLRLVCTYAGPCSEWLDARAIVPGGLAGPRIAPGLIRRDARIETCTPLDVALFKGSAWPGNALRGAVHRSPLAHEPRLLLTLDPLD